MSETFNIYCDESCHLEHDKIPIMVLGAVWCKRDQIKPISIRIREMKQEFGYIKNHGSPDPSEREVEIKWTNVSRLRLDFYLRLIDFFFDEDDLHFRGVVINKCGLDHPRYRQTHDDWYYKMLFTLLEPIIDPSHRYQIYLDIKDTRSEEKRAKLEEILRSSRDDQACRIVKGVQQIRSNESELMQLTDLLLGAIAYHNRRALGALPAEGQSLSGPKMEVLKLINHRFRRSLSSSTWLRESKFNLFRWEPKADIQ